ncbi:NUDIX hydrolase [Humibacillus xanthopallidus]|uniref:NUDIX hydrolase n=1 Tax=Humibacillus xanthopallidus TaxID=412689 RepID=UPI00115341B4|nr:NUDIX domain-containing protein [Humibacillus xanthopallidus]
MRTNVPGGVHVVGVVGTGGAGGAVARARLAHGADPVHVLAQSGWAADSAHSATVREDGALELTYLVSALDGIPPRVPEVPRDLGVAPDEVGEPYQRVAAYAVVTSERGVLLTQFNSQTHVAGDWGLPRGGLDDGESPVAGVHREVWEETGQRIDLGDLITVQSQHWVGRAPSGALEDFHAVRIVYAATCPEPTEIVIHDVGGTTSDARWVPVDRIDDYPLTSSWRRLAALHDLGERPGS